MPKKNKKRLAKKSDSQPKKEYQKRDFFGIFDFPRKCANFTAKKFDTALRFAFGESAERYCILHDRDEKKDGTKKTKHIHFYVRTPSKKSKKGFIMCLFSACQAVYGKDVVAEEITASFANDKLACLRYMLHLDSQAPIGVVDDEDIGKKRYEESEVVTNNKATLDMAVKNISDEYMTAEQLIKVCFESKSFSEVLLRIGARNATHYCQIIKALISEKKKDW